MKRSDCERKRKKNKSVVLRIVKSSRNYYYYYYLIIGIMWNVGKYSSRTHTNLRHLHIPAQIQTRSHTPTRRKKKKKRKEKAKTKKTTITHTHTHTFKCRTILPRRSSQFPARSFGRKSRFTRPGNRPSAPGPREGADDDRWKRRRGKRKLQGPGGWRERRNRWDFRPNGSLAETLWSSNLLVSLAAWIDLLFFCSFLFFFLFLTWQIKGRAEVVSIS